MTSGGEAKIFLSEKRERSETDWHRSLHTLNFGAFNQKGHEPFFDLAILNDETLGAGRAVEYLFENDSTVLIVPVVGGISLTHNGDVELFVEAGESVVARGKKNSLLKLRNPFDIEPVNYVALWITANVDHPSMLKKQFDLDENKNSLVPIFSQDNMVFYLGNFRGRIDSQFSLSENANGLFAFVIEGALEFDNRLLQQRDGIAIWNKTKVEFEALSTEAIILLVEI